MGGRRAVGAIAAAGGRSKATVLEALDEVLSLRPWAMATSARGGRWGRKREGREEEEGGEDHKSPENNTVGRRTSFGEGGRSLTDGN